MSTLDIDAYIVRMFDEQGKRHEYWITDRSYPYAAVVKAFDMFLSDSGYNEMFTDGNEKIIAVCSNDTGFTEEGTEWFKMCAESTIVHNIDDDLDIEGDMDINLREWMDE